MMTCRILDMTLTGRKSYALLLETNSINFWPQWTIPLHGNFHIDALFCPELTHSLLSRTSAFDKNAQAEKPLNSEELELIRRLYAGENPDSSYDPYEPMTEWFTGKGKEEIMPLSGALQPKRRWVPSRWEKQKVR